MLPALPPASLADPLRDPTATPGVYGRAGSGAARVHQVEAPRPSQRDDARAATRDRPHGRAQAAPEERPRRAWPEGDKRDLRGPWPGPASRWGATLFLAQSLGQLDADAPDARDAGWGQGPGEGPDEGPDEDADASARRPRYDGPDPHGFGTAAYRLVGAEPPLYRENAVVFRLSV